MYFTVPGDPWPCMAVSEGTGASAAAAGAWKTHWNGRGWLMLVVAPWNMHIPSYSPRIPAPPQHPLTLSYAEAGQLILASRTHNQ